MSERERERKEDEKKMVVIVIVGIGNPLRANLPSHDCAVIITLITLMWCVVK